MEKINNLITVRQAAKISGYNPDYLGFLIRSGKLNGKKVGKSWVTTAQEVERYLAELEAQDAAHKAPVGRKTVARISSRFKGWLSRRLKSALRFMLLLVIVSGFLALVSYGAYAAVYNTGYNQAQSASSTLSNTSQAGTSSSAQTVFDPSVLNNAQ